MGKSCESNTKTIGCVGGSSKSGSHASVAQITCYGVVWRVCGWNQIK